MKKERIKMTNDEKLAKELINSTSDYSMYNMSEDSIESTLRKDKTTQYNKELEKYQEQLESNNEKFKKGQEQLEYDINKVEIKHMFSRLLIKPFEINPFQKMEVKGGLIVDAGGYTPHVEVNPMTGKYEEQKQFIITGYVVEVGPETKYLREGDVVYYRIDTSIPVPFFKQGLVSVNENQIIAVVNEGLEDRFNNI